MDDANTEQSFWQRRWKLILNIVTVGALVILAIAIHKQIGQTFANLTHINLLVILALILIEAWNYDAQARLYRSLFGVFGNKLSYKFLYKLSLELNFINLVFPSGGVSGISYFGIRMRSGEVTAGRATLVQLMKLILIFLSFDLLMLIGLFSLAISGEINELVLLVAGMLTVIMVGGTLVFAYIVSSRARINHFFTGATRVINHIIHVFRRGHAETINIERAHSLFDDFHDNYLVFRSKIGQLQRPFWHAFMINLSEVLAVYVIFIAFGHWVNIGAVILAYAVANFAGVVSVMPGGAGVYEALMTGVLVIAGVPAALSLPVIVMYRVINTIIQMPPGYYYYHKTLHGNRIKG